MIDQTIVTRPKLPILVWILGLVTIGSVTLAVCLRNVDWAIFALWPLLCTIAVWWAQPNPFSFRLNVTGIEAEAADLSIAYSEIDCLRANGVPNPPDPASKKAFEISVFHPQGRFDIPPRLDVKSAELFHFLWDKIPKNGSRVVNKLLVPFLETQLKTFGPDKVFTFRSRMQPLLSRPWRGVTAFAIATLASAAAWLVLSLTGGKQFSGWFPGGITVAIIGAVVFIVSLFKPRLSKPIKQWRDASIVISPLGLAMVQGDLKGEIRWEEIRRIKIWKNNWNSFQLSSSGHRAEVTLCVEGAEIPIWDIYDRPVSVIREIIESYHE